MSESLILQSDLRGHHRADWIHRREFFFGIARGFLATTSILLGAEAALWWGGMLGHRLSDTVDMREETGHFLCGMALLILTVLLLGVGGSIVLSWGTPTRWGSTLGAALGAANGALLIGMALRLYFLAYAGSVTSLSLDDSIVTRVLWRNYDWFVLGFIAVASSLLLYTRFARLATSIPDLSARFGVFAAHSPTGAVRPITSESSGATPQRRPMA